MPFDLAEANPIKILVNPLSLYYYQNSYRNMVLPTDNRRFYSSRGSISLNPEWITGFTDGEGSFIVSFAKHKSQTVGYSINPSFQIKLNMRDLELLKRIQVFFGGCGKIDP